MISANYQLRQNQQPAFGIKLPEDGIRELKPIAQLFNPNNKDLLAEVVQTNLANEAREQAKKSGFNPEEAAITATLKRLNTLM